MIPTDFLTGGSTISRKRSSKCIEDAEGLSLAKWGFIPSPGTLARAVLNNVVLQGVSTERNPFRRTPPPSASCCPSFLVRRCLRETLISNQNPNAECLAPNQPCRLGEMGLGEISAPWRHHKRFVVPGLEVRLTCGEPMLLLLSPCCYVPAASRALLFPSGSCRRISKCF